LTAQMKTPEQIAAEVVQATYGPEAGASAHATMSRVLDVRDEYTAADIFDLMHAAIEADRAQRAELEAGARELLAQYDRDELNGPHETAECLAEALRDLVGER